MTQLVTPIIARVRQLVQRRGVVPTWLDDAFSDDPIVRDELRYSSFRSRFVVVQSDPPAVGQCVTEALTDDDVVVLATSDALNDCNFVSGVVIETGRPGDLIRIANYGLIPRQFLPFVGEGANDFGLWNTATMRIERLGSRVPDANTVIGQIGSFGKLQWQSA